MYRCDEGEKYFLVGGRLLGAQREGPSVVYKLGNNWQWVAITDESVEDITKLLSEMSFIGCVCGDSFHFLFNEGYFLV